ncbi:abortive infection family protein [Pedobacter agri]|uniref:abortive infection family protein n=1 Tax=Pedobacter agri TaxID=454586 RepID=UPI002930CF80|nr:abortive infection family protein [Pedobacter agri]
MQHLIAKLKPLYDDLKIIGLHEYIKRNEFLILCNKSNLTDIYTTAFNEVQKREQDFYSFLGDFTPYEDVLANFLNHMFEKGTDYFFESITIILEGYIPESNYVGKIDPIVRDLRSISAPESHVERIIDVWSKEDKNYFKKANVLKNACVSRAIGGSPEEENYDLTRKVLLQNEYLKTHLPKFIIENTSIFSFWQFIKAHLPSYYERKVFLNEEFEPLLNASVSSAPQSHHNLITAITKEVDEHYVSEAWNKALRRMKEDPEGAITSARTLMETVFKHILYETNTDFDDSLELNKLYKLVSNALKLSPDQHTQPLFKQILGGCQTVIEGLGGLRNKLSDAHGGTSRKVKPSARHSELAVNLSGSVCSFLLQTLKQNLGSEKPV